MESLAHLLDDRALGERHIFLDFSQLSSKVVIFSELLLDGLVHSIEEGKLALLPIEETRLFVRFAVVIVQRPSQARDVLSSFVFFHDLLYLVFEHLFASESSLDLGDDFLVPLPFNICLFVILVELCLTGILLVDHLE